MKVSLTLQINEVKRELLQREQVYPRLVSTGKMRQSIADYQTLHMRAVLTTLEWFQQHEEKIKAAISAESGAKLDAEIEGMSITQRAEMFADKSRGGYFQIYGLYDGETKIGTKTVSAETRSERPVTYYSLDGVFFATPRDFAYAYKKAREAAA